MMFRSSVTLVAFAITLSQVFGHSAMVSPEGFSPSTCRLGEENSCDGPCDLRAISYAGANYYPPSADFPDWATPNPQTAATYQRGQEVSIASSRNNHAPGGYIRLALVPEGKMMSKEEHAKYAFHYSCWGAGVTVATESEIATNEKGFSLTQADGDAHDLPKAYYTSAVTIPTHIPDGKYVLGWIWYGGLGSSPEELTNDATSPPGRWGYMGLYWSCSWVEIKGGPMTNSYTPVFVNDLPQFSDEGCPASVNTVDGCIYEPCGLDIEARFMKPAEFENGPPPPLLSSMYGATGAADPETLAPTSTAPISEKSNCGGPCDVPGYICGIGLNCSSQVCTCGDGDVCESEMCVSATTTAPVMQAPVDPSGISKCGGACDTLGYVCESGLTCSDQVCSCGVEYICENQMCAYEAIEVPVTQAPMEPARLSSTCGGPCDMPGFDCASGLTCAAQVCTCASGNVCENEMCVSTATEAPVAPAPVDPSRISRCGGACDNYGYVCGDGLSCSNQVCVCGGDSVCENQICVPTALETTPEAPAAPEPKEEVNGLYLQVYTAGLDFSERQEGPRVTDGMQLCPRDYPSGMTIVCEGVDEATTDKVTFYQNGRKVRVEHKFPYAIASDWDGHFRPWRAYGEKTIRCETNTGLSISASVNLTCDRGNSYDSYRRRRYY